MNQAPRQTIIHLVHGTWANGWFKPKNAWFEDGSPLAQRLAAHFPAHVQLRPFYWSGRNRVGARDDAAAQLAAELSTDEAQSCDHILVAHSHGGTVAYEALQKIASRPASANPVRGLICMGTPFVSVAPTSPERHRAGLAAVAALLDALFWTACAVYRPAIISNTDRMLVWVPAIAVLTTLLLLLVSSSPSQPEAVRSSVMVPTYLLRATRDEASLSLGMMQAFNGVCAFFSVRNDLTSFSFRKPVSVAGFAVIYMACTLAGFWLAASINRHLGRPFNDDGLLNLGLVYSFGVAGLILCAGYLLLAWSVGYFQVRAWLRTQVEVDAAPPGIFCTVKIYSALSGLQGMRHGLYQSHDVVDDIGAIIDKLMVDAAGASAQRSANAGHPVLG